MRWYALGLGINCRLSKLCWIIPHARRPYQGWGIGWRGVARAGVYLLQNLILIIDRIRGWDMCQYEVKIVSICSTWIWCPIITIISSTGKQTSNANTAIISMKEHHLHLRYITLQHLAQDSCIKHQHQIRETPLQ